MLSQHIINKVREEDEKGKYRSVKDILTHIDILLREEENKAN